MTTTGFFAGGQMVQCHIGFAAMPPPRLVRLRYVVGSTSSWLHFDPGRPQPTREGQAFE